MADFERIAPGTLEWGQYHANHIHRYVFAANILKSRNPTALLDAACGVGYGSNFLASQLDARVVGVDRSVEALAIARREFSDSRITWSQDDCSTLAATGPLGPFDAVVSLETIEHLPHPRAFLTRCAQLSTPHATLIASTPNALVTESAGERQWEFHEKEYTPQEFETLLSESHWSEVRLFGQQLNEIGRLREDMRRELHTIASGPFNRAGALLQRKLRGHRQQPLLPEKISDFEMVEFASSAECSRLGKEGPFVLIAVASREG